MTVFDLLWTVLGPERAQLCREHLTDWNSRSLDQGGFWKPEKNALAAQTVGKQTCPAVSKKGQSCSSVKLFGTFPMKSLMASGLQPTGGFSLGSPSPPKDMSTLKPPPPPFRPLPTSCCCPGPMPRPPKWMEPEGPCRRIASAACSCRLKPAQIWANGTRV